MPTKDSGTKTPLNQADLGKNFGNLLNLEDRQYLLKYGTVYNATTGTVLCSENEMGDTVFVVLQGEVEITKGSNDKGISLGKLGIGELVGEISALLSMPRIATVTVSKPSIILEIAINDFSRLLEKVPSLKTMVYKRLCERSIQTTIHDQKNS